MGFYDEVLRELLVAMGAALFLGNLMALLRRRAPAPAAEATDSDDGHTLQQAPLARTVTYLLIGFIVALWGVASLVAG
ncbi:MAG: hypothetical protein QOE80_970 [Actinomycetota bacterium]|jgi:predicted phage tail protein|nr:hypothetical protein [Actinomycetota bacterium]